MTVLCTLETCELECQSSIESKEHDEISPCLSQCSLCTISRAVTVPSESTVVCIRFHACQLQLCRTVTDKAAAAVLAQDRGVMCPKNTSQFNLIFVSHNSTGFNSILDFSIIFLKFSDMTIFFSRCRVTSFLKRFSFNENCAAFPHPHSSECCPSFRFFGWCCFSHPRSFG